DHQQPIEISIGRQNDLEQAEPSTLTLLLDNADDALTYGNPLTPYPWWGSNRRCRIRETIAGYTQDLLTGWLQVPDETITTAGIDQKVRVNVVDWLGRLRAAPTFTSALAEYIRYPGSSRGLMFYAPLNDSPNWADVIGGKLPGGIGGLVSNSGYTV